MITINIEENPRIKSLVNKIVETNEQKGELLKY